MKKQSSCIYWGPAQDAWQGDSASHLTVAVIYSRDELLKEKSCLVLTESTSFHNSVKQFTTCCVLHHNSKVCGRQEDLQVTETTCIHGSGFWTLCSLYAHSLVT